MAKRTSTLGTAPLRRRRTGAEALEMATGTPAVHAPAFRRGGGRNQAGWKTTTIKLDIEQWRWLRAQALARSQDAGTRSDASEVIRELVAAAMAKDTKR